MTRAEAESLVAELYEAIKTRREYGDYDDG
jgi:hypothetical protein